jgi:hypothetical protein
MASSGSLRDHVCAGHDPDKQQQPSPEGPWLDCPAREVTPLPPREFNRPGTNADAANQPAATERLVSFSKRALSNSRSTAGHG